MKSQVLKKPCCTYKNQSNNGPVNAHLISWPSTAQKIQNLENIWLRNDLDLQYSHTFINSISLTKMMFIKHYAPNRCLCIKVANSIDHWVKDCRIAQMSQRQGEGGYVQRMEVIVKRKKSRGGGGGGGGLG